MRLVVMTEEKSMAKLLERILIKVVPAGVDILPVPHNGKSDLKKSLPIKLKGWNYPNDVFLIVQDQDSNDCRLLKNELLELTRPYNKPLIIRIACRELEAWYWGDLAAVSEAYKKDVTCYANRKAFRIPDQIQNAKSEFQRLFPEHQQIRGAEIISEHMDIERNCSQSFQALIAGTRKLFQIGIER